jgi:integrase
VFTREDGGGFVPEFVSRTFRAKAAAVGVPVIRFHDSRHRTATLALASGVFMRVVSDRLGTVPRRSRAIDTPRFTTGLREAADRIASLILPEGGDAETA